jgi:hypothetical protein
MIMCAVVDAPESGQLLAWICGTLEEPAEGGPLRLYAILDGARDQQIVPRIRASGVDALCLFDGELDPALAAAAPYLIALEPAEPFIRMLLAKGWDNAWGILLTSAAPLGALRRHFRRYLKVVDEDGRQLMFRYYDPRVLQVFLPTCTAAELEFMFGPVRGFLLKSGGQGAYLRVSESGDRLEATSGP